MTRDLTFSDWPMFDRVMRNPGVCRQFLQVVLGIEVGRLDYVDIEKSLFPDIEAISVRLDVFGKGIPRYTFKMHCSEDISANSGCGIAWIVLNAKAWEHCANPTLKSLLKYTTEGSVEDDALVKTIDGLVKEANENREWRKNAMGVMTLEHDMAVRINVARKEGLAEGKDQGEALEAKRYNSLIDVLLDANRSEDLKRAAHDDAYRDQLFKEFGIA